MRRALLVLATLAAAPAARAEPTDWKGSPRWGAFEARLSGYRPNIDAEFNGSAYPYNDIFGSTRNLMARFLFSKTVYVGPYGTVDLGLGAGYWERYGNGRYESGAPAPSTTALKVIPLQLAATYRFEYLVERLGIPFQPYARISLERYHWSVLNGGGSTASWSPTPGTPGTNGSGATNGWSFTGGMALLLDFFDPALAREMDRDSGINHAYLTFDATKSRIKDFNSSKSWDLSDDAWTLTGGLLLVF